MIRKQTCMMGLVILFLTGCASEPINPTYRAEMKKVQEPTFPEYKPPKVEEGSLWSAERGMSLFTDIRAKRVGDTVTIRIVEDPEAAVSANTKTSRSSGLSGKLVANSTQSNGVDAAINSTLDTSYDGKGTSDRDGHVNAYITAMVINVLPNGNLFISGKRQIKVNHELQYITISGIIRPEDVTPNNEVSSTYIADARIAYSGVGPVSDNQSPGWLARILSYVWPF